MSSKEAKQREGGRVRKRGPWWRRGRTPIVPVIRLQGVIAGGASRTTLSLARLEGSLTRAFKFKRAKAVALAINSPGGSPVQSALITDRIRALAERHEVPVLSFIEDVGASGGYWLALAGDEIYAERSSIVGSIGVISAGFGLKQVIDRVGIERRTHTAGTRKAFMDPFQDEDPNDVARLEVILTEIHETFRTHVRERRGERLTGQEAELFEGQIFTGLQAVSHGLVDGVGTLDGVLRERFGEEVRLPAFAPGRSWFQRRFGFGTTQGAQLPSPPVAEPRAWVDAALDAVEERLLWGRYGL